MKKVIVFTIAFTLVLGIFSCRKKGETPVEMKLDTELLKDTTQIEYLDSVTYHFDTIQQGDKVEHDFRIKNVGQKNFVISRAYGSCGCTVPSYPKDPVKPGEVATIHVVFNSAGKQNLQDKKVTVMCNTAVRSEILTLTGFVKAKE
jgi:hypothetical protein